MNYFNSAPPIVHQSHVNISNDPRVRDRISLHEFENLDRQSLLQINPRMYTRIGSVSVARELPEDDSWRDVFGDSEAYGRAPSFEALAAQLRRRRELQNTGQVPIDADLTRAYESLTSNYLKYSQHERALLGPDFNQRTEYQSGITKLIEALPQANARSREGVVINTI